MRVMEIERDESQSPLSTPCCFSRETCRLLCLWGRSEGGSGVWSSHQHVLGYGLVSIMF